MRRPIPAAVISVCSEIISRRETHATLDSLFMYASAPGEPPPGSKHAKALEWLRATNKTETINPIDVLGRLIESYMEETLDQYDPYNKEKFSDRERIAKELGRYELQYLTGGKISGTLSIPSRTLETFIKEHDIASIELEFNRALSNLETNAREAVSAASNILESVCKAYIEENEIQMPAKQDLKSVWLAVRKHLGFDPSTVEDQDLQKVLTGLISIVEGIGSLRTHASSAHGAGTKFYKLEPRHARLACHSAHTATLFILESWHKNIR